MSTALLICGDTARSQSVIHALEEDHDVWHVARHRDAIAWLRLHQPQMVVIDLDLDGLDHAQLLDTLLSIPDQRPAIIGLARDKTSLPPGIADRLDQILAP